MVSALSQGVPSLATGWSHKYKMLFDDYNFAEGLLTFTEDFETIAPKLDLIANEEWCSEMSGKLEEKANVIKASSIEMWTEIFEIISKNPRARR